MGQLVFGQRRPRQDAQLTRFRFTTTGITYLDRCPFGKKKRLGKKEGRKTQKVRKRKRSKEGKEKVRVDGVECTFFDVYHFQKCKSQNGKYIQAQNVILQVYLDGQERGLYMIMCDSCDWVSTRLNRPHLARQICGLLNLGFLSIEELLEVFFGNS